MSLWSKIIGTAESFFQIGLGGPQWKNDKTTAQVGLEARTLDDATYVAVRGADPQIDDDLTTKRYTDARVEELEARLRLLVSYLNAIGIEIPEEIIE